MEDEIDLRAYVEVLLRWKWWIAGLALAAAVAALGVSMLTSKQYEATALVAVTRPRYVMRFDPRFETTSNVQPVYKAYPELAGSDALLQEVLAGAASLPDGVETLDDLREIAEAKAGADPSIVHLAVRSGDPTQAAALANLWAERFVTRANELYSGSNVEQVAFFEEQLVRAEAALEQAEQALVAFQARNEEATLKAKLTSAQHAQADYLADQRQLERLLQDITALRAQLAARTDGSVTRGDELAVLQLRTRALSSLSTSGDSMPSTTTIADVQLQVGEKESLAGRTVAELTALLDVIEEEAARSVGDNEGRLAALEPQILSLQQKIQEVSNEGDRLTRAHNVAQETYTTLARKVAEAHIAVEDTSGEVQLASRAAVPERAVGPRKLVTIAIAGTLGLVVAVFGVLVIEWWRGAKTTKPSA